MNLFATTALAGTLAATTAIGAGLDRSGQGIDVMFEQGNAMTLSFSFASPTVTDNFPGGTEGFFTGDITPSYGTWSMGYKQALSDKLDLGFVIDQPFGADVLYGGLAAGTVSATVSTMAATALVRYHFSDRIAVHAGLRAQTLSGDVTLAAVPYALSITSDVGLGYVVGASYEIPEIALRAAVTYNSAISHTMTGTEAGLPTSFAQDTPQSVNFDFQTGIAADTLVMASVRWVDWSGFSIAPPIYGIATGGALTDYDHDGWSFELGVGHRFTDALSGAVSFGYEPSFGDVASNLGPTDGYWSVGVGGSWQANEHIKFSGGLQYRALGDATNATGLPYTGNSAIGGGLSITTTF